MSVPNFVTDPAAQAAYEVAIAGADDVTIDDATQAAALKAAFESAAELVEKLEKTPGQTDLLKLYGLFKQSKGEKPVEPSVWDLKGKAKYRAWKEVSEYSAAKAQALYIQTVADLIESIGFAAE